MVLIIRLVRRFSLMIIFLHIPVQSAGLPICWATTWYPSWWWWWWCFPCGEPRFRGFHDDGPSALLWRAMRSVEMRNGCLEMKTLCTQPCIFYGELCCVCGEKLVMVVLVLRSTMIRALVHFSSRLIILRKSCKFTGSKYFAVKCVFFISLMCNGKLRTYGF